MLRQLLMNDPRDDAPDDLLAREFATTHWSVVLRAGNRNDRDAHAALTALCEQYWYPLYAYVRRCVNDVNDAQDLTQEFFARLLERNTLAEASPQRGRFRNFLLAAMKNFLADEADRANAQKRGGGRGKLSLDLAAGESRLNIEVMHNLTAERIFERQWAMTLLESVMRRLEAEYLTLGKAKHLDRLKGVLSGNRDRLPYAALAAELGMSEEAVRQAARRVRNRYRELLREEIAQTVAETADVEDEIRSLFQVFAQ